MMNRTAILVSAIALAPSLSLASDVRVHVEITEGRSPGETWIEFRPEQDAYVAVYAAFSDGNLRPIFPVATGTSHWVSSGEVRRVQVAVPPGTTVDSIQAVASPTWFDPGQCWVARARITAKKKYVRVAHKKATQVNGNSFASTLSGVRKKGARSPRFDPRHEVLDSFWELWGTRVAVEALRGWRRHSIGACRPTLLEGEQSEIASWRQPS